MTRKLCEEYVSKWGRYHRDSPESAKYSVRYPPAAPKSLFSDDTYDLVEQVFKKSRGKTANGKYIKKKQS